MSRDFLAKLSDGELLDRAKQLVLDERRATALLIAHLGEIERRRLYLEAGCRSLFAYCQEILHLSEHAAYNRIEAARLSARFPMVLSGLAAGDLHLAGIRVLAPALTAENYRDLLAAAKHKSRREIEELVARLCPRPEVATLVRKLPAARLAPHAVRVDAVTEAEQGAAENGVLGRAAAVRREGDGDCPAACSWQQPEERRTASVQPLSTERYKMQLTIDAATRTKLQRARDLLRHQVPNGDLAAIVGRALDVLIKDLERKKLAAVERPQRKATRATSPKESRPPGSSTGPAGRGSVAFSRHIPADVKRTVWERDQGQCTFIGRSGLRCSARGGLEFDHIRPYGDGGTSSIENVRLLCRQHNQYEARQYFGEWRAASG